jgi:hypothetical protein
MTDEATYLPKAEHLFQQARAPAAGRPTRLLALLAKETWQAAERARQRETVRETAGNGAPLRNASGGFAAGRASVVSPSAAVAPYLPKLFEVVAWEPVPSGLAELLSRLDARTRRSRNPRCCSEPT